MSKVDGKGSACDASSQMRAHGKLLHGVQCNTVRTDDQSKSEIETHTC